MLRTTGTEDKNLGISLFNLNVDTESIPLGFAMSMSRVSHTTEYGAVKTRIVPWTEKSKSQVLRWAAGAWWKAIGSFPLPETKVEVRAGKRGRKSQ